MVHLSLDWIIVRFCSGQPANTALCVLREDDLLAKDHLSLQQLARKILVSIP
jgi:hypothetical protein